MEIPLDQIGMRFAAMQAGVDPDLFRKGKLSYFARKRVDDAYITLGQAHNFHLYAGNFNKTTADVDILIQEIGPDLICIDGMYLMKPADVRGNMGRYERAAYVVDDLKRMTLTQNRPIVGTTQFGKGAGDKGSKGSLETIGYTDTIPTHASIICSIKPGKEVIKNIYGMDENMESFIQDTKIIYPFKHIEILKGRGGESGSFGMRFSFAPFSFDQVPVSLATGKKAEQVERPNLDYME
jgi:hypothetical protein